MTQKTLMIGALALLLGACAQAPRKTPAPVETPRQVTPMKSEKLPPPGHKAGPAPPRRSEAAPPGVTASGISTQTIGRRKYADVAAYQPPEEMQAAPVYTPAITGLLEQAQALETQGRLSEAAAKIERALDQAPKDAFLWHRLAQITLAQNNAPQAEELAERSNAHAAGDLPLQRANWRLIADARRMRGDQQGAIQAEAHARSVR